MRFFIIFAVGIAILSLELTASKILKPYFGDSLYIWAAILSTTLLCMAMGYALGGRISRRFSHGAQAFFYNHAPAVSGIAIMIVAAFYPLLFKSMALSSLVLGCFAAAFMLIGPALIMLAGMPPLLVALHRQPPPPTPEEAAKRAAAKARAEKKRKKAQESQKEKGADAVAPKMTERTGDDAGAGRIYTLETLGAIAGVLITAFLLMPGLSSYESYMLIGAGLTVIAVLGTLTDPHLNPSARSHTRRMSAVAALLGVCLFGMAYLNDGNPVAITRYDAFAIKEDVHSPFGGLKVVDFRDVGGKGWRRLMLNQGIAQAEINAVSRPARIYQYVLPGMAVRLSDEGDKVLVLGLGGGIITMETTYMGRETEAVEIDPRVTQLAEEYFVHKPDRVRVYEQDARTFMRACDKEYGAVVIDLFRGDGVPEHLVTKEFFSDMRDCLQDDGGLVLNIMYDDTNAPAVMALLATISDVFGQAAFTYPDPREDEDGKDIHEIVNAYVYTTLADDVDLETLQPDMRRIDPAMHEQIRSLTRNVRVYRPDSPELAGIQPMRDENNPWRELSAPFSAEFRRVTLRSLHRALLVD